VEERWNKDYYNFTSGMAYLVPVEDYHIKTVKRCDKKIAPLSEI